MKNFKIITLVLATLLSCSSQNDPKQDSIIGQWQLIEIEGEFPTQIEMIEKGISILLKMMGVLHQISIKNVEVEIILLQKPR